MTQEERIRLAASRRVWGHPGPCFAPRISRAPRRTSALRMLDELAPAPAPAGGNVVPFPERK